MSYTKKKLANLAGLGLKLLVLAGTFYYLYNIILNEGQQPQTWLVELLHAFTHGRGSLIMGAVILLALNWGLEACKWQKLAAKIERLTFKQAYQAVLVGLSLGFVTPNRLGDYAGRLLALQSRQRLEALGAIFLGRYCQLAITVVTGSVSFFYFLAWFIKPGYGVLAGVAVILLLINGVITLLLFWPGIFLFWVVNLPVLKPIRRYVKILTTYTPAEVRTLLRISSWRYGIFMGQFMLLLYAFGVQLAWYQMALAISGTFLLKSVIPSINALTDVGMRELSAVYFFSLLGQTSPRVMSASLSLWFINICIPSLAGLLFIWQLKIKIKSRDRKNQEKLFT